MANTYKVCNSWKTAKVSYSDEKGNKWKKRRSCSTFEYGKSKAIKEFYEYKNSLTTTKDLPKVETVPAGSTGYGQATYPTGEPISEAYQPLTSGQQALYNAYTGYLNDVTWYNNDLKQKLKDYFKLEQAMQNYSNSEMQSKIDSEYNKKKMQSISYADWLKRTEAGTLNPITAYQAPSLTEEVMALKLKDVVTWSDFTSYLDQWKKKDLIPQIQGSQSVEDFQKGATYGYNLAESTGLTRIAAMGMAGMPDQLVKSMAISTQIHGNTQRIMGQQDQITAALGNISAGISDITRSKTTGYITQENYKQMYLILNEQAKRKGIIKGDWTLRLSNNLPIKEKWRRLYVTLSAYIAKKSKQ